MMRIIIALSFLILMYLICTLIFDLSTFVSFSMSLIVNIFFFLLQYILDEKKIKENKETINKEAHKIIGCFLIICLIVLILSGLFFLLYNNVYLKNIEKDPMQITTETSETTENSETTSAIINENECETVAESTASTSNTTIVMNEIQKKYSKRLTDDNPSVSYCFTVNVSGTYRFDYRIDDVNKNYSVQLKNRNNKEIFSSYFSFSSGKSCILEKGNQYILTITKKEGDPEFTILVGIPEENVILEFK